MTAANGDKVNAPALAALAVVVHGEQVLLVRRRKQPDRGLWGYPGGHVEPGEAVPAAATRELGEETGVQGQALGLLDGIDVIGHDADGQLQHHFYLAAVQCRYEAGEPLAGDDAMEAAWHPIRTVLEGRLQMSDYVEDILRKALLENKKRGD